MKNTLNKVTGIETRFFTIWLAGILLVILPGFVLGQAAIATWSLSSDLSVATSGNISASALTSNGVNTPLQFFTGSGVYTNGWPTNYLTTDYYQYTISPSSGFNLNVSSISFYYRRGSGGEDGEGRVYYSLNGFSTAGTQLGSNLNITNNSGIQYTNSTSITVPNGSTLTIRVYAYSLGTGNFYNMNMVISGTTTPSCPTITASVTGQTNVSCNAGTDGTITASASGGTAPYTFSSDNGTSYVPCNNTPAAGQHTFTGLSANVVYRIRVKDANGCESAEIQ